MTVIAITLAFALVASNVFWLVFLRGHIHDERTERWQLQERIREPDAEHVPIAELMSIKREKKKPDPVEPIFTDEKPIDEYDLVGKVDPPTPLREDDVDAAG